MADELVRTCFRCGRELPAWDFPLNRAYQSGRDIRCVDCVRKHREQFEGACIEKFNRVELKKQVRKRR